MSEPKEKHKKNCNIVQHIGEGCSCKEPKKMTKAERRAAILELAQQYAGDGEEGAIDFDDDDKTKISEGDDNGTYVSCWVWVPFDGTALCKGEKSNQGEDGNHDNCSEGCPVFDAAVKEAA